MLIIIEGIDKTGKTTLCNHLSKRYGLTYDHHGPPKGDAYKEYMTEVELTVGFPHLVDRFHLGEMVYPKFKDRPPTLSWFQFRVLERYIRVNGGVLIFCNRDPANIMKTWVDEEEHFLEHKQMIPACRKFMDVVSNSALPTVHYNFELPEALEMVERSLNKTVLSQVYCDRVGALDGFGGGGSPWPELVLVGEQGGDGPSTEGVPFDSGPAAEFIDWAVDKAGIPEDRIYWTNAIKVGEREADIRLLNQELEIFGRVKTVALGGVAREYLHVLGINEGLEIPHPSHWRRFQWERRIEYAKVMNLYHFKGEVDHALKT